MSAYLPNFASRRWLAPWVSYAVLGLGALTCATAGLYGAQQKQRVDLAEAQTKIQSAIIEAKTAQERKAAPTQKQQAAKPLASIAPLDRAAREEARNLQRLLGVDWMQRLAQAERASQGNLVLTSMRMDSRSDAIELRGQVGGFADIDALRQAWLRAGVPYVMINRQEAIERDGKRAIEFQANLSWDAAR